MTMITNPHLHEQAIDAYNAQYNDTKEKDLTSDEVTNEDRKNQQETSTKTQKRKSQRKEKSLAVSVLNRNIDLKALREKTNHQNQTTQEEKRTQKLKSRFKKEYRHYLNDTFQRRSMTAIHDQVNLSNKALVKNNQKQKAHSIQSHHKTKLKSTEKILQQYIHCFSEELIQDSPKKREKSKVVKEKLLSSGVSPRQIKQTESNIKQFIQADIKKEIRKRFLNLSLLCENKKHSFDLYENFNEFNALNKLAQETGVFGEGRSSLHKEKAVVKSELSQFVADELDRRLVETRLKTNEIGPLKDTFNQLNNLSRHVQFNASEYIKHVQNKLNHLGLNYFVAPHTRGTFDTTRTRKFSKTVFKKKKPTFFSDIDGEVDDSIENHLRSLYIRQYTTPSIIAQLKLKFKIMKFQSYISHNDSELCLNTLLTESKQLAKLRLSFMLRESFEERATLPVLSGSEYRLIKRRIKFILKGLKSLGSPVSRSEQNIIMHQSNTAIFTIVKEDYIQIQVHLESNPKNVILIRKRDQLLQILNRLKQETKINESIKPKLMQDMSFLSDISITEAA